VCEGRAGDKAREPGGRILGVPSPGHIANLHLGQTLWAPDDIRGPWPPAMDSFAWDVPQLIV
jgi:hypothetical protein